MKSSKGKGLIGLLILLIAVGLFFRFLGYDTMDDIKLGLDLAGGVSITYQAVEEEPGQEEMSDTIYKLQQRVQNYSTEAEVYQEGNNRINIDIPGVSDANAILEELGKPGSLIFADENGQVLLTGDQVASAKAGVIDQGGGAKGYIVSLTFTEEGSKAFADATAANVGKRIAVFTMDRFIPIRLFGKLFPEDSARSTVWQTMRRPMTWLQPSVSVLCPWELEECALM